MSKELVQVMREDAQRLSIDPDFGGPLCVLQELENAADIIERQSKLIQDMFVVMINRCDEKDPKVKDVMIRAINEQSDEVEDAD